MLSADMRLGIDLGTTRTIVAAHDRGNFPVVGFVGPSGDLTEHYPSVCAEVGGRLVFGLDAEAASAEGAPTLRSFKRLFAELGPNAPVAIGTLQPTLLELCVEFLGALRRDLFLRSNLPNDLADPIEVAIGVPANAHSTQRFMTLEAFRRAGFSVLSVLNEPSAAGIEFAHRHTKSITSRREHVVVYDLGGGTFDAALVAMAAGRHDVLATGGVARLGGDDFDEALLAMALERADVRRDPTPSERVALLMECRLAKEALNPNSRRIVVELSALGEDAPETGVVLPIVDYYERVRPLVAQSIEALAPIVHEAFPDAEPEPAPARASQPPGVSDEQLAGLYVVGGASGLPLVPRMLRERFGRRVHRSPHPAGATAIGLAIAAADEEPPELVERFTRHLGVFRERDDGAHVSFDGIFPKGTPMPTPGAGPLVAVRTYRAAHNVGHYRFVECSALDDVGDPCGDITWHAELRFPFARELRDVGDLDRVSIERMRAPGPPVEERYEVDAAGIIAVAITDLETGYARRYVL